MVKIFNRQLIIIIMGLLVIVYLNGCDSYESQLNDIMHYDKTNRVRLFLPVEKKKDGRYFPEHIEIKYVDQQRVFKEIDIERKEELITYLTNSLVWYQPEIVENVKKAPLKKEEETEEEYANRIFNLIPEMKSGRKIYRTREDMQREVWDLFRVGEVGKNTGNQDFLFWVTYWGLDLTRKDQIEFSIVSSETTQRLEKILIREGGRETSFELGFESAAPVYRKNYLLVCKGFKPELKKRYTLKVKGDYMAKETFNLSSTRSVEYNEWLKKEIWWKIHRQIDFYIDEAGNCHFENERYLIDETLNPSVNFHSNRPREMLPAN